MTRLLPPGEPADQPSMDPADSPIDEQSGLFSRWSFAKRLSAISGLALALRLAYVLFIERGDPLSGDALYYHEAARLLADGFGFIEPYRLGTWSPRPAIRLYGCWSSGRPPWSGSTRSSATN